MPTPSGEYRTIKALVLDYIHRTNGRVDYDALTSEVKKHFPQSLWKKTHWVWYRYQATRGRFRDLLSEKERENLRAEKGECRRVGRTAPVAPTAEAERQPMARGPQARDPEVKQLADPILNRVRCLIARAAGKDEVLTFKINRWIFARLLQDEIRVKRPIKKALWDSGQTSCQVCRKEFHSLKGVEIHRKDSTKGYSENNCLLTCRECHQELAG
ncbi:MAG: hypothetical protein NTX40_01980 [Planctomycetota bacterium]|nr:hypothetical protein [Planctomycetota bacterium]